MTYPPIPPGPGDQWPPPQPPYPPQQPPYPQQQQFPQYQQPYPQYQQPQQPPGYDSGPGAGYAPGYGYGYGAPPPGYPYQPPRPPGGNRKWLVIAAVVAVVAVLAVVGIIAVVAGSGGSKSSNASGSSSSSSEEDAIRALFEETSSISSSDISEALPYFCAADQDLMNAVGDLGSIDLPTQEPDTSATISDIQVNGSKATARIDSSAGGGKMYFRKEGGDWKFCMSDMPGFPTP